MASLLAPVDCSSELVDAMALQTTRELLRLVGGLSTPSKMPGYGYGLPAAECGIGSKLRAADAARVAEGLAPITVCGYCYAMKGRYVFANVLAAMYRRLALIDTPEWPYAMAELINRAARGGRYGRGRKYPEFRWHDSGDIQTEAHCGAICLVAALTPDVAHWIPTREYQIVASYVESGGFIPPNLNVRLSAPIIGGRIPSFPRLAHIPNVTVSAVSRDDADYPDAYLCPARHQGNSCGDCRACWNTAVPLTIYPVH